MSERITLERTTDAPAPAGEAALQPSRWRTGLWQSVGPFVVFLVIFVLVSVKQPSFITGGGLTILTTQAAPILLVALGQAVVLHIGSLDLSNAAITLLSAVLTALMLGPLGAGAPLVCLVITTTVGLVNGLLFAYTQVPSFALTLGTLGVLQAAALVLTKATTVYVTANPQVLAWMFGQRLALVPAGFFVAVLLAGALWSFLRFTGAGQAMTAVGLNETGAIFSGIRTRAVKIAAFGLSGFLAGVAGLTIIAQAGAASSFGLGSDLLLPGIAAAILGGTAITGGLTNPLSIVFGALTVALLPIGAALVGVPPQAQSLVYGLVIIVAVALTISRSRSGLVK